MNTNTRRPPIFFLQLSLSENKTNPIHTYLLFLLLLLFSARTIPEDCYRLDPDKTRCQNACDIFRELASVRSTESRRLSVLTAFVKFMETPRPDGGDGTTAAAAAAQKKQHDDDTTDTVDYVGGGDDVDDYEDFAAAGAFGVFRPDEFLACISASLVHPFTQVRAGALRAIRYLLRRPTDIRTLNQLQLPYLICRSLDILLDNEEERVQALKLVNIFCSLKKKIY